MPRPRMTIITCRLDILLLGPSLPKSISTSTSSVALPSTTYKVETDDKASSVKN